MAKQTSLRYLQTPVVVEGRQLIGAVVVRYGDTTVLSTAVMSNRRFLSLQVNYGKMYAVPGAFVVVPQMPR